MKIINSLIFLIIFFVACSDNVNTERDKEFFEKNVQMERTSKILKRGN
tara:strand:+ start:440 stop:583 length:144 start_codon:yes stop_codon:yes gene_type:complete